MRVMGLLVDLDGTLYVGNEPVEGASEAVERLQASASPCATSRTPPASRAWLCASTFALWASRSRSGDLHAARAAAGLIGDRSCYPWWTSPC